MKGWRSKKPSSLSAAHLVAWSWAFFAVDVEAVQLLERVLDSCPPPADCNCHCDCPEPVVKEQPPPDPPCPFVPIIPGQKTTHDIDPATVKCPTGQVKRSTGECSEITPEAIQELQGVVSAALADLNVARKDFQDAKKNPTAVQEAELRKKILLKAHDAYETSLDMLLGAWDMAPFRKKKAGVAEAAPGPAEFIGDNAAEGKKAHCESWPALLTGFEMTKASCGIVCRQQPACTGFSMMGEGSSQVCIWFGSDAENDPESACAKAGKDASATGFYLRNEPGRVTTELGIDISKDLSTVARLQDILSTQFVDTDTDAKGATTHFDNWMGTGKIEGTDDEMMEHFLASKQAYSQEVVNTKKVWVKLMEVVRRLAEEIQKDAEDVHPFPEPPAPPPPPPKKKPLSWSEHPNSQDTKWSQKHPECPQGPPCVCECACRGSPAQNFVPAPPPPPKPCPKAVPPPASGISAVALLQERKSLRQMMVEKRRMKGMK
ncbi:unnamed protein product [Amoebophrya sp. A25]|nr:unnamed protein product [Amoebophrya sp. A25]|eukprot:GSA25T00010214001.1